MASVYKGKRTLSGQARRYFMGSAVFLFLFVGCVWGLAKSGEGIPVPFYLLPAACLGFSAYTRRRYKIFRAGAAGEKKALAAVRRLPSGYHIFTNFLIQGKGRQDEADFIVVGETGIFVVEVKHHGGKIVGAPGDAAWKQERAGRRKNIRNPVEQTARHAANLTRLLRGRGRKEFVQGILVFTNPRVWLEVEYGAIMILRGEQKLNAVILHGETRLDENAVNAVVACLKAET